MTQSTPFRGALIGCGYVSQFHLEAWKHVPGTRLIALCDVDPDRLERAGKVWPQARKFRDAAAMFDECAALDFVEVCTQPESHRALVGLAASRRVNVLCQKPAAVDRLDLLTMIDACAAAGVRFMVHENWRFRPWYRALRREIAAGTIGRPIRLRIAHRDTRSLRPDGFGDQPYFTGRPRLILLEMGCHLIDAARFLFGEIKTVSAAIGRFGPGVVGEDVATLSVSFESGAIGLLDMSWCSPADLARPEWALNETVVEGTAGALKVQIDGSLQFVGSTGQTSRQPVELPPEDRVYLDGYIATQAHFIDGLRRGTEHETCGLDTLKTMHVVWSAYRSAEEGRAIMTSRG